MHTLPSSIRLSDSLLLSDLIGCHSVYTKGYANVFDDPTGSKLAEGKCLAANVLEPILADFPISISYGYISFDLAHKIVTYQHPAKPSYHQWNDGAAADICVHEGIATEFEDRATPAQIAMYLDDTLPLSRCIAYSESPFICVATRVREIYKEGAKPRHALYENRYQGRAKAKPLYIQYSDNPDTRAKQKAEARAWGDTHDWIGAGYPTYHGGGIRQLQHIRAGQFCMYSDFMYSDRAVFEGLPNALLPATGSNLRHVQQVGRIYDTLLKTIGCTRLSIVRAYESPRWSTDELHTWKAGFAFTVVPPLGVDPNDVAQAALHLSAAGVNAASVSKPTREVTIQGLWTPL